MEEKEIPGSFRAGPFRAGTGALGLPPFLKRDLLFLAFLALFARLLLVGLVRPSLFWDSGSFLQVARWILTRGFPPPVTLRPPGYPLFLLAAGGGGISLEAAALVQRLLGAASVLLVYLAVRELLRRRGPALGAAILFTFMPDLLFMEVTIYSETLALFFVSLSLWLLARRGRYPRSLPGWTSLGLCLALGILTRPILAAAAPFYAGAALTLSGASESPRGNLLRSFLASRWASLGAFLVPLLVLVGGMVSWNGSRYGLFKLADGMGFSSLDYVGYPTLYKRLPPSLEWVTKVYESKEREKEPWLPYVRWGLVYKDLMEEARKAGWDTSDWDRTSLRITLAAARARPGAYLRIWMDTFLRFWTKYDVIYGLWERYEDMGKTEKAQVCVQRLAAVRILKMTFSLLLPFLAVLAFLSFPLTFLDRAWKGKGRLLVFWLWLALGAASLANTALEPCMGQSRYRMPWTPLVLLLASVSFLSMGRFLSRFSGKETDPSR